MNYNNDSQDLELASIGSRLKAFVIDDLLITLLLGALFWDSISQNSGDFTALLNMMNQNFFQVILVKFIYQAFFIWYFGATIGKIVAKIRVIDYDNFGRVSLLNSALRSVLRVASEMFFYIGFIFAFFTDSKQTLHDKLARTLVVNV